MLPNSVEMMLKTLQILSYHARLCKKERDEKVGIHMRISKDKIK